MHVYVQYDVYPDQKKKYKKKTGLTLKALRVLVVTFPLPPTERERERAVIKRQTFAHDWGEGRQLSNPGETQWQIEKATEW